MTAHSAPGGVASVALPGRIVAMASAVTPVRPPGLTPIGKSSGFRAAAEAGEIHLYDEIGAGLFGGISSAEVAKACEALKAYAQVDIFISSMGGDVFEGIAIYNLLSRLPGRKVVHVDGVAASIASIIALCGDHRITAANALWMIHEPAVSGASGRASEIEKLTEQLQAASNVMAATYSARTGRSADEIRAWMAEETWFTAEEAKAAGFCHEVQGEKPIALAASASTLLSGYQKAPPALRALASVVPIEASAPRAEGMSMPTVSESWVPMCFGGRCSAASVCCQECPCKVACAALCYCPVPPNATKPGDSMTMHATALASRKEKNMKTLLAALKLSETATEAEALAALTAHLQAGKPMEADVAALLALAGKPTLTEAIGAVQGLKAAAEKVPVLEAKLAEIEKATIEKEREQLIADGKTSGKLPPALEAWAKGLPVDQLKAFLAAAVPVVTMPATARVPGKDGPIAVGASEKDIAARLGVKPEDVVKRGETAAK